MDGKEFYIYAKACNDHNIKIYPKCSNTGRYKIIVERNGHEKEGSEIYENEAHVKLVEIHTPKGIQKVKKLIPSVWDKIFELYKQTCEKNNLLNNPKI